jgi:hypothetical protein
MALPSLDHWRQRDPTLSTSTQPQPPVTERDSAGVRGFPVRSLLSLTPTQPRPPATERDPAGVCGFPAGSLFLSARPNPDHLRQREIWPACMGFQPDLSFSHPDHLRQREIRPRCSFFQSNLILAYFEEIHRVFFILFDFLFQAYVSISHWKSKKCLVSAMTGLKLFSSRIAERKRENCQLSAVGCAD